MARRYTASIRLAFILVAVVFAIQVYQAARRPIGSREACLYDRFVRPTTRQVLASELLDRDVLYALLEKRSVGLFHVSPFSVRLPALLFGILYLWSAWQLARRFLGDGWWFLAALTVAAVVPLAWGGFARAEGGGAALALALCAVCYLNLAGIFLGLSIAARMSFTIQAALLALAILAVQRRWTVWVDRVLIPAIVVAVIFLVLPLSHAHAGAESIPELTDRQAADLQSTLRVLRATAGTEPVSIGASPAVEPVANFYRAEYRATQWLHIKKTTPSEHFDYYLIQTTGAGLVGERHLVVLHRDGDFLLAR